ncbi:MAG: hypothetical protein IKA71_08190 [Lentisphaeria bacterium]|nr:hypothetical protein [Lentisphaeria bacterium]
MDSKSDLFRISPRIVPENCEIEITVSGRYAHTRLGSYPGKLTIDSVGADGLFTNGELPGYTCGNGFDIDGRPMFEPVKNAALDEKGVLRFKYFFRSTGEHSFRLKNGDRILGIFSIYSLPEKLLKLRPFRGDMHIHSGFSGCNADPLRLSPEYMAAICCARGMDFCSISDHKQHFSSLKAADFTRQCGGCFTAYPSEEVHLSDLHNIHILNFGGQKAVSCTLDPGDPGYDRELAHYLQIVPQFGDRWLRHLAANWHLICDRIRQAGGLVVFCHPFWRPNERLFLPECIREYVFEKHLYDALELFGDSNYPESLDICAARYQEQCLAEGSIIPSLGNSDAHNGDALGINTSIVFAEYNSLPALQKAILEGNCIALSRYENSHPRTSGKFELVNFYHFLKRNYYPRHDALCMQESELMFQALENGGSDSEYDEFITLPYKQRKDSSRILKKITFAPDTAAFAALKARRAELDKEFWN